MKNSSDNPYDLFNSNKKNETLKSFSDELLSLKGKWVELFTGEQCETINYDEISVPINSSIFGEIIEVMDRFIILNCLYIDKENNIQYENRVYINTFQIRAMTVLDGNGSLQDIFLNVKDAKNIRKLIRQKGL